MTMAMSARGPVTASRDPMKLEHRHVIGNGVAAGALQQAADPAAVLDPERLIQSQPRPKGRQGFRRGIDSQDDLGRVAGQHEKHRKDGEGDQKKHGRQADHFFNQIAGHGCLSAMITASTTPRCSPGRWSGSSPTTP